ncbi:cupredoxin domain-containing protein [Candidatus Kuenenbacteria bacterium]|nr:cupredoxin domain-containing protein [Candidatus Kuenenbacteria bacterium]
MEKLNKKSIIDISIMILIAVVAIFFIWNVLVKDSSQSTKTKKSKVSQDDILTPEIQQKIMPGVSPVTKEGKVVTPEGKPVRLDVVPGTTEAPQLSNPIKNLEQLPAEAVKLIVTEKGLQPLSFTVKAGGVVNLIITSGDSHMHMFRFKDPLLSAVEIGPSRGETLAMVFNAPEKAGEYEFYCDVPGHENRGEKGKMIVK